MQKVTVPLKHDLCNEPDAEVTLLFAALLVLCGISNQHGYVTGAREHIVWAMKYRGWCPVRDPGGIMRLQIWAEPVCSPE